MKPILGVILLCLLSQEVLGGMPEFTKVGNGWCRPDACKANDLDCALHLNGFRKENSNSTECKLACANEPSCMGYAISSQSHKFPNRCYIYGNIQPIFDNYDEYSAFYSEWEWYPNDYFVPTKSDGQKNVGCYKIKSI